MGIEQRVLKVLIALHPHSFRDEFGHEMLLDYCELEKSGSRTLLLDAALSLAVQWFKMLRPGDAGRSPVSMSPTFLTNQPAMALTSPLTPYELAKGLLLSVALLFAFWYAEDPMRAMLGSELRSSLWRLISPQTSAESQVNSRVIVTDVSTLNLESGAVSTHRDVVVVDGVITSIGPHEHREILTGTQFIDGHGKFLMPGLWDMHAHIKHPNVDFPVYLANGVLGLRNMGGEQDKVFAWDAKLKEGSLLGPLAFVSGPILDGPGGPVEPKSYGVFIADANQARTEVDALKARGADFVKVYDALSRESYFAIAAESKKDGLPFAGHVPNEVTILEAVHAGQRSIEHGIEHRGESTAEEELIEHGKTNDYFKKAMQTHNFTLIPEGIAHDGEIWRKHFSQTRADDLYREFAKNGTYLCPTLVAGRSGTYGDEMANHADPRQRYIDPGTLPYWQPSANPIMKYATPAYKEWRQTLYKMILQQIPRQQELGVQLLAGTDLTVPFIYPGSSVHDEVRLLADAGLTPLQALQTATTHPVAFFHLEDSLGSIAVGKRAELVLLDGNPLQDLRNLDRISAVLTHKRAFLRPELDRMETNAANVASTFK
ncbi:amidohydrolase family protein [Silvibacterium acidisoli]|uniref:amidohydrolase family protein n=1 Tax=Acidobacteriaceae bacterium ZG23-2 TaxID=2883246 RepID=UPI00406C0740